jgi:hypothetical protein
MHPMLGRVVCLHGQECACTHMQGDVTALDTALIERCKEFRREM